ncbi:hypothetical protein [Parasphingorhabdus sp.]|uniref:hypothetical protein n=1 Tax=Parasphingorhabdus sp. TaxID=2709688 RepID=UPI003A944328
MATNIAAVPTTMDAFIEKQARADAVVNIVLAGGINYWLTRDLPFIPAVLPFGDPAPNLGGTLIAIAVLMSVLLSLIVWAITVSQRKAGKIVPGLLADTRSGFTPLVLALKHLMFTLVPAILIVMILQGAAPELRFSPMVFTAIVTVIAAVLAYFMSKSTTRATLQL